MVRKSSGKTRQRKIELGLSHGIESTIVVRCLRLPDGDIACTAYEYNPARDVEVLGAVVSLKRDPRGDKLVVLVSSKVVVARSGANPLA